MKPKHRIYWLAAVLVSSSMLTSLQLLGAEPGVGKRQPHVILLLADDMNYDSPGFMGGRVPELTPNLDRLAASGIVFTHCYNATAICGPSRAAMMTGLYPQSNGDMGHNRPIPAWWENRNPDRKISSLATYLREHGYFTAKMDKSGSRFDQWDEDLNTTQTGVGRDPSQYYVQTKRLIEKAQAQGKPFFMNINSRDPHEYWAGHSHETLPWANKQVQGDEESGQSAKKGPKGRKSAPIKHYPSGKPYPEPSRTYSAAEIALPPGYPDDAELREDIKYYYGSVKRLDETVGKVLQALAESGDADNAIVMFWSDNGIGWPYCKWSDYPNGTRTPLVIRWPGHVPAGRVDQQHVLSTVDVMPTVLEAIGLPQPDPLDGISFLRLMEGRQQEWNRNEVFDCFNFMGSPEDQRLLKETKFDPNLPERSDQYRPMRGLHSVQYTYIWSGWSDGELELPKEMAARGRVMKVLEKIAENPNDKNYAQHKDRAGFYLRRVPEELYDTQQDPGCLYNLANDPGHRQVRDEFRAKLHALLKRTNDHELNHYQQFLKQGPNP